MLSIINQHTEHCGWPRTVRPAGTPCPSAAYPASEMDTSGQDTLSGKDVSGGAAEWPLGRLLSMAARLVEQDWNSWLASRGMTHAGLLALHVLRTGPHTQRALAAASMVEEQTMSRVLDRLEREGHVTRERDPADRRRLVVRSTTAGQQAYRAAIEANIANTIITRRLDEPEALRRMLIQLIVGLLADRGEEAPGSLLAQSAGDKTSAPASNSQRANRTSPLSIATRSHRMTGRRRGTRSRSRRRSATRARELRRVRRGLGSTRSVVRGRPRYSQRGTGPDCGWPVSAAGTVRRIIFLSC